MLEVICSNVFQLAKEFGEEFNKHIDQYLQRIVNQIREDVGKCWPMSQAYNATIVAGCQKILNPYVSLKLCVLAIRIYEQLTKKMYRF